MKTSHPHSPVPDDDGPRELTASAAPESRTQARLADWLWAGARDLAQQRPSPHQDRATVAAMGAAFAARPAARRGRRWALIGPALCASVLLACVWLISLAPPGEGGAAVMARGSDFIVLVPADRWAAYQQAGAATTAWLVPAELPRERLALLGLPYDASAAAEPVRAELLVHASGDVLAMRVMP